MCFSSFFVFTCSCLHTDSLARFLFCSSFLPVLFVRVSPSFSRSRHSSYIFRRVCRVRSIAAHAHTPFSVIHALLNLVYLHTLIWKKFLFFLFYLHTRTYVNIHAREKGVGVGGLCLSVAVKVSLCEIRFIFFLCLDCAWEPFRHVSVDRLVKPTLFLSAFLFFAHRIYPYLIRVRDARVTTRVCLFAFCFLYSL